MKISPTARKALGAPEVQRRCDRGQLHFSPFPKKFKAGPFSSSPLLCKIPEGFSIPGAGTWTTSPRRASRRRSTRWRLRCAGPFAISFRIVVAAGFLALNMRLDPCAAMSTTHTLTVSRSHHRHPSDRKVAAAAAERSADELAGLAVGETVILLHPPRPLVVSVSIRMERERQQNDSLANG